VANINDNYFLEIPGYSANLSNFVEYLKSTAKIDASLQTGSISFHHSPSQDYFELFKIADRVNTDNSALEKIASEYFSKTKKTLMENSCEISKKLVSKIKDFTRDDISKDNFSKLSFFIETYRRLIFFFNDFTPNLISKTLLPLFFKIFSEGEIYAVRLNCLLEHRFGILRGLQWITNQTFMKTFNENKNHFPGFNTLKNLHMFSIFHMDDFFHPLFISLTTFMFGFTAFTALYSSDGSTLQLPNNEFIFIFLFGENINWQPIFKDQTLRISEEVSFSSQHKQQKNWEISVPDSFPLPIEHIYKPQFSGLEKRELEKPITFTAHQYSNLLKWWTEKLDSLFNYLLDPTNFADEQKINPERQFLTGLTIDRIFKEISTIEAEMRQNNPPFVSFQLSFAVLDKISNLIAKGDRQEEPKVFEKLLSKNKIILELNNVFNTMPKPFDNYFRIKFKKTFEKMVDDIEKSIFLKGILTNNDEVKILDKNLPVEEYLPHLIRSLRNSHHGYLIKNKDLEYLKVTDGDNLINVLPKLIKFYIFWLLDKVDNLKI